MKLKEDSDQSEDELDAMDLANIQCYNCKKKGHLARDCPHRSRSLDKSKRSGLSERAKEKRPAKSLHSAELSEDGTESNESSASGTGTNGDGADTEESFYFIDTFYEVEDGIVRRKGSKTALPVFDAKVNGVSTLVVIDGGSTTEFIRTGFAEKLGQNRVSRRAYVLQTKRRLFKLQPLKLWHCVF